MRVWQDRQQEMRSLLYARQRSCCSALLSTRLMGLRMLSTAMLAETPTADPATAEGRHASQQGFETCSLSAVQASMKTN